MPRFTFRPFSIALVAFVMLGSAFSARAEPKTKAILWPTTTPAPLAYSTRAMVFDGYDITVGLLTGEGIEWGNQLFQSWVIAKDSAGYSIAFFPRNGQKLRLGIAVFAPNEFLSDISDTVWDSYLAGLQHTHDECEILEQASATSASSSWKPVLGVRTRSITFRYPVGENDSRAETQLFAFCEGHLAVFVLSGPEKEVIAATPAFYSSLLSFQQHAPPQPAK